MTTQHWNRRTWLCVALSLSASSVRAEDAADTASASAPRAADTQALPPVVVPLPPLSPNPESPTRREPTGAVSVLPVEERRSEAAVASELVGTLPGVLLQDSGGLLQTKTLSVRGASSTGVLVLLDGIPLNGAGNAVDLSRVPLAIVDRLELLRGSGSLYGSGALGGVLNIVTRRPTTGFVASGGLTVGSFGTGLGNLSASGALLGGEALVVLHGERSDGGFSYLFDATPLTRDDVPERRVRRNNDVSGGGALVRYRRALSEGTELGASAEYATGWRGVAGTAQNPTTDVRMRTERLAASTRVVRRLSQGELSGHAWASRDVIDINHLFFTGPQPLLSTGLEGQGQWLLADRHGVTVSARVGYEALDVEAVAPPRWMKASLAASDEILLFDGALTLVPSARVDLAGPFTTVSPKAGAVWSLPAGFEVRANVGQAHRAPSFLELYVVQGNLLPNPSLRPERALGGDVGVRYQREGQGSVTVTGFYNLFEDLIAYEYYPPLLARPYNFNTARVQGLETELEARPSSFVSLSASHTLTFSQNLRDDPRYYLNELPYRPRHRVHARVTAGPQRLKARAELDFQSSQFVNRTQTVTLPARALLNAGATALVWQKPDVRVGFDVKNLLDVQSADLDGYPLPGRAAYLTLSFALEPGVEVDSRNEAFR